MTQKKASTASSIVEIDHLIKGLKNKHADPSLVEKAQHAADLSFLGVAGLCAGLQFQLEEALAELIGELKIVFGETDITVTNARRALASCMREMKRFAEAEALDRLDPEQSIISCSILATDILNQFNPKRYSEAAAIFRQGIKLGLEDLPSSASPQIVRHLIGTTYLCLATLFSGCGEIQAVEGEVDQLIAFHNKCFADHPATGIPDVLLETHNMLLRFSSYPSLDDSEHAGYRLMKLASRVASYLLSQDPNNTQLADKINDFWLAGGQAIRQ